MTQTRVPCYPPVPAHTVSSSNFVLAIQYLHDLERGLIKRGLLHNVQQERVHMTLGVLRLSEVFLVLCIWTTGTLGDDTVETIPLVNVYVSASMRTVTLERNGFASFDYLISTTAKHHIVSDIMCLLQTPWCF